jgi:hypothetical protein
VTEPDDDETPEPATPDSASQARPPTPLEVLDRYLPYVAVGGMVLTFLLLQSFAIPLIGLVWLISTRFTSNRKFLGLTLTEALAWSATIVIAIFVLSLALYAMGAPAS